LRLFTVSDADRARAAAEGRTIANYGAMPESVDEKARVEQRPMKLAAAMKANPLRAAKEAYALTQVQMQELLRRLKEYNIGIIVCECRDDPIYSTVKMAEQNFRTKMTNSEPIETLWILLFQCAAITACMSTLPFWRISSPGSNKKHEKQRSIRTWLLRDHKTIHRPDDEHIDIGEEKMTRGLHIY